MLKKWLRVYPEQMRLFCILFFENFVHYFDRIHPYLNSSHIPIPFPYHPAVSPHLPQSRTSVLHHLLPGIRVHC